MTTRLSVVDIPIDDTKFKRFEALFQQYQDRLSKTPGMWQKVNKEFTATTAAVLAQNQAMRESLSSEREQVRHLTVAQRLWTGISGSARGVAGSMLKATATLLKWTGVFAGAGSIFGPMALVHMASDVSDERRQAMGLGTSIGGMKAFSTNFGRVVSPQAFLGGITEMRTNPEMQGALAALGISPNGSTMKVAMQVMDALRQQALMTPVSQLGLILKKFPVQGVTTQDLMRMRGMSNSEWAAQEAHFGRDRSSMNIDSKTALAWTNFTSQMERAGSTIFKTFVTGLLPLEKPLEKLSGSIVKVIKTLFKKDGSIEQAINQFAKWLDDWNGKISKPEFLAKVEVFTDDLGEVAKAFHSFADTLYQWQHPGKTLGRFGSDVWWAAKNLTGWHGVAAAHGATINNPGNLKFAGQPGATLGPGGFAIFGTPQQGLDAMARQLELYRLRGKDTLASIIPTYAPAKDGNDVAAYIRDLSERLHVSPKNHLDLGNAKTLAALMQGMIHHELGYNWSNYGFGSVSQAARAATSRMGIIVHNATGGSAVVSVNGLAQ